MTAAQRSYCLWLRVAAGLIVPAFLIGAMAADPNDNPHDDEVLPDTCVRVFECTPANPF